MSNLIQLSKKQYNIVRDMYLSGINPVDIAAELDVSVSTISYAIFGPDKSGNDPTCLYRQRLDIQNTPELRDTFTPYVKAKRFVLSQMEHKLITKINDSMTDICDPDAPNFNIDEAKSAIEMYREIDKINRLENNKPTEIAQSTHGMTLREIINGQTPVTVEAEVTNKKESRNEQEESKQEEGSRRSGSDGESGAPRGFYFPQGAAAEGSSEE